MATSGWSTVRRCGRRSPTSRSSPCCSRTDPDVPKHDGITYFGVDLRAPGVEVRPLRQITGETEFNEVFLSDVRIPELYRISAVGDGWAASHTTLSAEHVTLSGTSSRQRQSRGILGGKTIDELLELARSSTLAPSMRDRLAQAYIESKVLALTVERSAAGGSSGHAGAVTKIRKATVNQDLQVLAVELLGAGATAWPAEDAEIARYNREFLRTRANSIEGGTSEIQRNVIGERVLGLPANQMRTRAGPGARCRGHDVSRSPSLPRPLPARSIANSPAPNVIHGPVSPSGHWTRTSASWASPRPTWIQPSCRRRVRRRP